MVSVPELTLLFIIGLLVLGPEKLPRVATQIGRWVGRARRTANQLRYQLEREIALSDLQKTTAERNKAKLAETTPEQTADQTSDQASEQSPEQPDDPAGATSAEEPAASHSSAADDAEQTPADTEDHTKPS